MIRQENAHFRAIARHFRTLLDRHGMSEHECADLLGYDDRSTINNMRNAKLSVPAFAIPMLYQATHGDTSLIQALCELCGGTFVAGPAPIPDEMASCDPLTLGVRVVREAAHVLDEIDEAGKDGVFDHSEKSGILRRMEYLCRSANQTFETLKRIFADRPVEQRRERSEFDKTEKRGSMNRRER